MMDHGGDIEETYGAPVEEVRRSPDKGVRQIKRPAAREATQ
jgi:hypothetical protein